MSAVPAKCHPGRPHEAHGLCYRCYKKTPAQRAAANKYRREHPRGPRPKEQREKRNALRRQRSSAQRDLENRRNREWCARKRHAPSIYLVLCPALNAVKIGRTTSIGVRLKHFRIGSPAPLELVALIPGTAEDEKRLHERFAHARSHGEWFRADEISQELLEAFKEGLI